MNGNQKILTRKIYDSEKFIQTKFTFACDCIYIATENNISPASSNSQNMTIFLTSDICFCKSSMFPLLAIANWGSPVAELLLLLPQLSILGNAQEALEGRKLVAARPLWPKSLEDRTFLDAALAWAQEEGRVTVTGEVGDVGSNISKSSLVPDESPLEVTLIDSSMDS